MPANTVEPVIYVEPNWVYRKPEDYSIYVDLIVETRGKTVSSTKTGDKDTYVMEWVADGSSNTVSFMGGSSINVGGGVVRSLTTNYTDTYLEDLREGKVTQEYFGIESINIDFNSYFVPQVTIQFTDIRGISLFAMAEDNHSSYHAYESIGSKDVARDFFNSFFSFPYPTYKLVVKGFYGNAVSYTLNCSDFRANFDATTGNFKATVKFIGNTFAFFNDVSFNALLCAPYSDAGGLTYWESRKLDKDYDFYLNGTNNQKVNIPTLAELLEKLANIEEKIESETVDNEAVQHKKDLEDKMASLNALQELVKAYIDALNECKWLVKDWVKDLCNIITMAPAGLAGVLSGAEYAYLKDGDSKYIVFVSDDLLHLAIIARNANDAKPGSQIDKDIYEEDKIKSSYSAALAAVKSAGIQEQKFPSLSSMTSQQLFTIQKSGETYSYLPTTAWTEPFSTCKEKALAASRTDNAIFNGEGCVNGFLYSIDISDEVTKRMQELQEQIAENEKYVAEAHEHAMINILGFLPTVYNFCKIIMAHLEVYMKLIMDCAVAIYEDPSSRTPENLGMNNVTTDMNKKEVDEKFVPPFPKISRQKHVSRHVILGEGAGENYINGQSLVDEEDWAGSLSTNFQEVNFINGMLNGAKKVGGIMMNYIKSQNEDTEKLPPSDSGRESVVSIPIVPQDMYGTSSPWGDRAIENDASFAGKVFLRMHQLFTYPGNLSADPGTVGRADAINFAKVNSNPQGTVLKAIQNQGDSGTLSYENYFKPIVTGRDGKYKVDGNWPWMQYSQYSFGIADDSLGYNIYICGGITRILPIFPGSFTDICTELKTAGNSAQLPSKWDNYSIHTDRRIAGQGDVINPNVFLADPEWATYGRLYGEIPDEYASLRQMFKGCVYDKNAYSSYYNTPVFTNYFDGNITFDSVDGLYSAKLKTIPGFSMEGNAASSTEASVFGQLMYYKQTSVLAKAFLFLKAFSRMLAPQKMTHYLGDIANSNTHFILAPKIYGFIVGSDIWYEREGKNIVVNAFGAKEFVTRTTYGGKRFRKEIESALLNDFKKWATGDFQKIDTAYSIKLNGIPDSIRNNIVNNEQDLNEGDQVELYLDGSEHPASSYIDVEDFSEKYVGDKSKQNELFYFKSSSGFKLNPKEETQMLNNVLFAPTMFVISCESRFTSEGTEVKTIPDGIASAYWDAFIKQLTIEYKDKNDDREDETDMTINTSSDSDTPIDLRIAFYHYTKVFYDKWVAGCNMEEDFEKKWKLSNFFKPDDNKGGKFHFVDSFYNYLGDTTIVNPQILVEDIMNCTTVDGYTLLSVLGDLLSKNRFKLVLMENFLDMSDPNKVRKMFETVPYTDIELGNPTQDFVVMYTNEPSSKIGSSGNHPDDSFMLNNTDMYPLPIATKDTTSDYTIPAFGVAYGMENQNYFMNVDVSMEKPMVTEESLKVQYQLCGIHTDSVKDRQYVTWGQDLFTIFGNNSYTCKVEMLGCAWIKPLMYFCLTNVPMFRGSYLIEQVSHTITPGDMKTTFTGVRMANTSTRQAKEWLKKAEIPETLNEQGYFGGAGGILMHTKEQVGAQMGYTAAGVDSSLAHGDDLFLLVLERVNKTDTYTEGHMYMADNDGTLNYLCDTIEDKDRGLTSSMNKSEINRIIVRKQTAIPSGRYKVNAHHKTGNPRLQKWHNGDYPILLNVPGFDGILIHQGVSKDSTAGCLILGSKDSPGRLSGSRDAVLKVVDGHLYPASDSGKNIEILIRNSQESNA